MADGTFDKDLDMLMKLALLKGILDKDKKAEAIPFAVEVVCTPSNILCRCSGNKKMLEDPIVSMYPPKSVGEKIVTEKPGFSLAKSNEQRKDGDADEGIRNDLP